MADTPHPALRRVLLGIGEASEARLVIDAAARLASRFGASVECLLVTHEDLLAAAGLPFTRAVGPDGLSVPLRLDMMEAHFRRLARLVEKDLFTVCHGASLAWQMEQRKGTLRTGLASVSAAGDLVVIGPRDLRAAGTGLLAMLREVLTHASAVVVPGRLAPRKPTPHPAPAPGDEPELVGRLTAALGNVALTVARIDQIEQEGEAHFLRRITRSETALVLLPPLSRRD